MKKIYFLLCILCSISAMAQSAASNGLQQQLIETWSANAWHNASLGIYTSDGNGYFTHILGQTWNASTSTWQSVSQADYTNTAAGNINYVIHQEWLSDEAAWENSIKTLWQHGNNGLASIVTTQFWDGLNWVNTQRLIYTYNASNKVTATEMQEYDTDSNTWSDYARNVYTLNALGNPTQVIFQLYSDSGNVYDDYSRRTFTYNASNLASQVLSEVKNGAVWVNNTKDERTYDAQGRLTYQLTYIWTNNGWVYSNRMNNSFGTLSVAEHDGSKVAIYPNPAKDILNLQSIDNIKSVSISSMDGKLFTPAYSGGAIDVSVLSKGIYFLMIETEVGTAKTKFIKQ